jgi:hypothetical protein
MNTQSILEIIQDSAIADWMRYTNNAMPVVEATHVLSATLLFGTVLIVDLRLLGVLDSTRAFTRISREVLPLTWMAFGISVITGSLMFTTNALTYFGNAAFQMKALSLFGAGLNMALFRMFPTRVAGLVSMLLWAAVVLLGRWIGFTKGYDFTIPPDVEFVFPG